MRSTGAIVLGFLAAILWAATVACLIFALDAADRLPSVIPIVVAIAAGVTTLMCDRRWAGVTMRDDLIDTLEALIAPRAPSVPAQRPAAAVTAGSDVAALSQAYAAGFADLAEGLLTRRDDDPK